MTARDNLIERIEEFAYAFRRVPDIAPGQRLTVTAADCALLLEALRAVPQWIPVGERLPELNAKVLVHKLGEPNTITPARLRQNGWSSPLSGFAIGNVTHWMPLPTPPAAKPDPNEENSHG